MLIRVKRGWEKIAPQATPEAVYRTRREVLRALGFTGAGLAGWGAALPFRRAGVAAETAGAKKPPAAADKDAAAEKDSAAPVSKGSSPVKRNPKYTLDRPLTDERVAKNYNNFYEFSFQKEGMAYFARKLEPRPWTLEVAGLVHKPATFDVDELLKKVHLEERLYRFRCVEAWAMAVPWTGFPLSQLIDLVEPLGSAKYLRFITFNNKEWAPNIGTGGYDWPYHEGLSMAEARNELTLLATGMYGGRLPKQSGAPLRLIIPWKYGFKGPKSIVRIEFVDKQPPTFWNTAVPHEYDFVANVDPRKSHPRWSQASERMIDTGERRPTLLFNGYEEYVADLYKKA